MHGHGVTILRVGMERGSPQSLYPIYVLAHPSTQQRSQVAPHWLLGYAPYF